MSSASSHWDCIVVGAGAAGLMASIQLALHHRRVLLVDGQKKIGAKILMSGGTRCNVTNTVAREQDYCSEQPKSVRNILNFYPPQESMDFFKSIGVDLIVEKNGQCYPSTQTAKTVLDALINKLHQTGAILQTETKVNKITKYENIYELQTNAGMLKARSIVLATGGLSYPGTGSNGSGYLLAQSFGHTLVPTIPALTPLRMDKNIWTTLGGISVDVLLTLRVDNKKYLEKETSLLFTHFGISGLGILDISRHWLRQQAGHDVKLIVCFLANACELIFSYVKTYPKRTVKSFLEIYFPKRFVMAILIFLEIDQLAVLSQLVKEKRVSLISFLESYELPVTDAMGYGKAEVTAGGIPFNEVHTKTLESRLSSGLFFCGEIMDVDGRIGGFNFQWAWASGVVVARGVDQYLTVI